MIIIRMTGGLGNQMFQYALYLKLKSLGRNVKLEDITEYTACEGRMMRPLMLWVFGLSYPRATRAEIDRLTDGSMKLKDRLRRKVTGRKSREYHERDCNFDAEIFVRETAYLTGYFQSEKYFQDVEKQVREAFVFSDKIWDRVPDKTSEKIKGYLEQIQSSLSVSIHVRRGDYLSNEEAYGGICTEEYYQKAIMLMQERFPEAVFFVFSNDMQWFRERLGEWAEQGNISGERFVLTEGTDEETGYLDMLLMSNCRHHIVANSSFSWWGAWLASYADKVILAPPKWFGNQDCRDIYTEKMIKVSSNTKWDQEKRDGI